MAAPTRQPAPTTPYEGQTFLAMQNEALDIIGWDTTTADAATVTRVKSLINEAIARINTVFPGLVVLEKVWTISVVNGQADYALPKGLILIQDPMLLDQEPVWPLPAPYRNRVRSDDVAESEQVTVRYYTTFGVNDAAATAAAQPILTLHPTPDADATLTIYGEGNDNALSADADLARIPVGFRSTPVWFVGQHLLASRSRTKEMMVFNAKWDEDMGMIARLYQRTRSRGMVNVWPSPVGSARGPVYRGFGRNLP